MATRRNLQLTSDQDKVITESQGGLSPDSQPSDIRPAVPNRVLFKLLAFTIAMAVIPLSSYFLTINTIFRGNSTYSGITAAVMANLVLFGYIIAAIKEDDSDSSASISDVTKQKSEDKKAQ